MTRAPTQTDTAATFPVERLALPVAVGWMLAVGALVWWAGWAAVLPLAAVAVAVLPVAVIYLFLGQVRQAEAQAAEVARLEARIAALRQEMTVKATGQRRGGPRIEAAPQAPAESFAPEFRDTPPPRRPQSEPRLLAENGQFVAPPILSGAMPPPSSAPGGARQRSLALVVEDPEGQLDRGAFLRALNFPEDDRDAEGFAAMRRALKDREARKVIQAAQDVLTLLSRDGIYMEDIAPPAAGADVWRRFAEGRRGAEVAPLVAEVPEPLVEAVAARMRSDGIFRDTALHFIRRFDEMLTRFAAQAEEAELEALGATRSARAFLLMARAGGTFD